MAILNPFLKSYKDLITTKEQTRAGFIEAALEKNRRAKPYIESAKTLRFYAQKAEKAMDLVDIKEIQSGLLTAAGLSDKAFQYFSDEDKEDAIKKMIEEFLIPAGDGFIDELVYRYLLIKGDSLGGSMRNHVGAIAEMTLKRKLLSTLNIRGTKFDILLKHKKVNNQWVRLGYEEAYDNIEEVCAIYWNSGRDDRLLFFNANIPVVKKNVDICLYRGTTVDFNSGNIVHQNNKAIMLGELKGGIDPAGADEHWKTANSALGRIRAAFNDEILTSFIAAAIESSMAAEIYNQLEDETLTNAVNMTDENQLNYYCEWLVTI